MLSSNSPRVTLGHSFLSILIVFFLVRITTAQDAVSSPNEQSPATAEAERVIVTGSHIPTAEEVGPNPVLDVDRDFINKSGERTAEQLIKNLPIAGPQGVPSFNQSQSGTPGASSISLRGFDPSDTLVLVDGRRIASYPGGGGFSTQSFIDLNSFPRAAIDSIEILKDSASATYGADAVAGVVNIKLRHNFRGAESAVEYGNTLDKDSSEFSASLVFGIGNEKTNVSGVLNSYHRNSIFSRDRGFSADANPPSTNSSPLNLQLSRDAVLAAGGIPPSSDELFFGHVPFFSNGSAPASDYTYTTFRSSFYNFELGRDDFSESERYGGYVNADHEVCGAQMVLYADAFYQNVKTHSEQGASATSNFQTPGQTTLAIPPHAPGPTLGGPSYDETGLPLGAFNPFNPFQQIISGGTRARLAEFGNRLINDETDAFFSTLGVRGDKLFDGSWGYDGSFRYSQIKNTETDTLVSASRFNRILNAADPIFDPTSSQFIGTTVPYNPFGDYRVPIATNSLPINFATIHPKEIDISKLSTFDLNIYTTELFKLPAGGFGLAFGGQFRREVLRQDPDQLTISGDPIGEPFKTFTAAGRKTYGLYAEADIPVFGSSFSLPGFHALEFTTAARFEKFLSNGSNVLVPKFGMRWQPFDDSLTLRATWGEGFHEPSLIELFASPIKGLVPTFDSVTGNFNPETPFTLRSNPNLQPEDSRAFSGGLVYTPKFISGLTITIDLFDIESKGRVNSIPNPSDIISRVFEGRGLFGENVFRDAQGNIVSIEGAFQNAGSQKARGADFGIQYQRQTPYGIFTSLTQATYAYSFEFAGTPDVPEKELVGNGGFFGSGEAFLRWKRYSRLDWSWKNFDLVGTVNYRDGFHETNVTHSHIHYVKQTWFFDGQASYDFTFLAPAERNPVAGYSKNTGDASIGKDGKQIETANEQTVDYELPVWKQLLNHTMVTLGCTDIFGQDPPTSVGNYPLFLYDPTGRFVYASLTKKF